MWLFKQSEYIKTVVERWAKVYANGRYGQDKITILINLRNLENPTKEQIDAVIGNTSWTQYKCHVCGKVSEEMTAMPALAHEEYGDTFICKKCLEEALSLLNHE